MRQHGQYCLIPEVVILLNESLEKATQKIFLTLGRDASVSGGDEIQNLSDRLRQKQTMRKLRR